MDPSMRRLLLAFPGAPLLLATYDEQALHALEFWEQGKHPPAGTRVEPTRDDPLGWRIAEQLREYFAGKRRDFDLPLAPGGTAFQNEVWNALRTIPFGETWSYRRLAEAVGRPQAPRAVGQANARNPIPVIIPCHRVLAAGGGLGGYMGSWEGGPGIEIKRWLLRHEGAAGL
ncbi:MAG TPA: methylated-DNA--[protein]-cysteine S-methyltransferase [Longimicrobium sp.]|nr:methylated-DNA--[protein]-cysteine S-methyltransferase [Longimicrobium sp.]